MIADSRLFDGASPVAMMSAFCTGSSIQLSLVTVVKPLGPWSSSSGSANGLGTPTLDNEGPIPRRSTCLGSEPVIMNPPIPTLASVRTRNLVETLSACAGPGVGLTPGDPPTVAVGVAFGVPVAVGVGVTLGDALGVGDGVGVGVTPGVGVGVAFGFEGSGHTCETATRVQT